MEGSLIPGQIAHQPVRVPLVAVSTVYTCLFAYYLAKRANNHTHMQSYQASIDWTLDVIVDKYLRSLTPADQQEWRELTLQHAHASYRPMVDFNPTSAVHTKALSSAMDALVEFELRLNILKT